MNHDSGDTDLLIVQTALKAAKDYPTVLTCEDTDLLVLALHHSRMKKLFTLHMNQTEPAIGRSLEDWSCKANSRQNMP